MTEPELAIFWIRHGESQWNAEKRWQGHSDIVLSERGRSQAGRLAQRLRGHHFDAIFTSDLRRARQTAELAFPKAKLEIDPRLREIHFGDFEGHRSEDLTEEMRKALSRWWKDPYGEKIQGGESMTDLAARLGEWHRTLPQQGKIAVVTHGGVIRSRIWEITGPPRLGEWTVMLDNTSLTEIHYGVTRRRVVRVNDVAHLDE